MPLSQKIRVYYPYYPYPYSAIFSILFSILLYILTANIFSPCWAYSKLLPILTAKQSTSKLSFISEDGQYTYYQKRPSSLMLSSKYSVKEVLTGPDYSYFTLQATTQRKKILIELNPFFFQSNNNTLNFIYTVDFGGSILTPVARGLHPKLHLNDTWISYFNPNSKSLFFQSLLPGQNYNQFQIRLLNPVNYFFIPEVIMYNEQTILFTDLNLQGISAIFLLTRNNRKIINLYKSKEPGIKIELCYHNGNLYIGQFPLPHIKNANSEISMINLAINKDFSKTTLLYSSTSNDIGNIECHNPQGIIYFVKNQSEAGAVALTESELVSLETASKKIKVLSDLHLVTQVINMDGRILIPFEGSFYVVAGKHNVDDDNLGVDKKAITLEKEQEKQEQETKTETKAETKTKTETKARTKTME